MPVRAVSKASARRSQTVASQSSSVAVHVTTTIISAQPATAAPDASGGPSSKLPVGVLVGSIAGGVVLAITVLLGWAFWGKSFRRRQRHQACTVLTTKDNAHSSQHARWNSLSTRSSEKSHLDVSPYSSGEKPGAYDKVSTPDYVGSMRQPSPPHVAFKPVDISQPRMLRKNRKQKQPIGKKSSLSPIPDVDNEAVDAPFEEPSVNPFADTNIPIVNAPVAVSRNPSTAGSASIYSTQSGEERQYASPSFVLATLGPPGRDSLTPPSSISHKASNVSSVYSCQSGEERQFGAPSNIWGAGQDRRGLSAYTRSSGSLHSTAEDQLFATWMRREARNDGGKATQLSRLS